MQNTHFECLGMQVAPSGRRPPFSGNKFIRVYDDANEKFPTKIPF